MGQFMHRLTLFGATILVILLTLIDKGDSLKASESQVTEVSYTRPFIIQGILYMPDGVAYRNGVEVTIWKWSGGPEGGAPRSVGEGLEAGRRIAIDIGGAPGSPVWVDAGNESAKQFYRNKISQIEIGSGEFDNIQNQRARDMFVDYRQNRVDLVTSLAGSGNYITGEELNKLVERQGAEVDAYLEVDTNQQALPDYSFSSGDYYREELRPLWNQLAISNPFETSKKEARIIGLNALIQADKSFAQGEYAEGGLYKDVALLMVDYVLGVTPGVGLVKDVYEAVTGINLITGQELDPTDRWLAVVGSVTLGLGDDLLKTGRVLGKISKVVDSPGVDSTTLRGWEKLSGILREARTRTGNYGLGSVNTKEADAVGKAWVGDGARTSSNGIALISADGLRQYRFPEFKPGLGIKQANIEWRPSNLRSWQSNGHLDVTD